MKDRAINFAKWFYPEPCPLFCHKWLVAYVEMTPNLAKLISRVVEINIVKSLPDVKLTDPT